MPKRMTAVQVNALLRKHGLPDVRYRTGAPPEVPTRGAFGLHRGHRFDRRQPLPSKVARWAREWQRQKDAKRGKP